MKITAIDAFGYFPSQASAIEGLSGQEGARSDPEYAFHTPYVLVNQGPCSFELDIQGISDGDGAIHLILYREGFGKSAFSALMHERMTVSDLIERRGKLHFAFDGERRAAYALIGRLEAGSSIVAQDVTVELKQPDDNGERRAPVRQNARLMETIAPTFFAPVCQPSTPSQFREPAYLETCHTLSQSEQPDAENWARAFILRALDTYGHLVAGQAGAALFDCDERLRRAVEAAGVELFRVHLPDGEIEVQSEPESIVVDTNTEIPGRPLFDFAWSRSYIDSLATKNEAITFIEESRRWLRPGGLLIHVTTCGSSHNRGRQFELGDIERAVLNLHSLGMTVGQIRIGGVSFSPGSSRGAAATVLPFGLIARMGDKAL